MGTRSWIGRAMPDGTFEAIFCHFDGYPDHHWPILTKHYATETQVAALMNLGDLSFLHEEIGEKHDFCSRSPRHEKWCKAYGRDRGATGTGRVVHGDEAIFLTKCEDRDAEYVYLFRNGEWAYRSTAAISWGRYRDPSEVARELAAFTDDELLIEAERRRIV